jgi:ATP-binding cassette, subfamily B, bacterial
MMNNTKWWKYLFRYARPYKGGISIILLLMLSGVMIDLLMPWPLKLIVDYVIPGETLPQYVSWLLFLPASESAFMLIFIFASTTVLLFLLSQATTITKAYLHEGVGNRMMFDLGAQLFYRVQQLSLRFHGKQQSGDLVQRITKDTTCVRDLVLGISLQFVSSIVMLGAMFIIMWQLNRNLTLFALGVVPFLGILIKLLTNKMIQRSYEEYTIEGKLLAQAEQTLSGLPIVQAYGQESFENDRYRSLSLQTVKAKLKTMLSQLQFNIGVGSLIAFGTAVTMAIGGYQVLQGQLTIGSLLVFLSYLNSLYVPVESLANLTTGYASASAGARRIFEILSSDEYIRETPHAKTFKPSSQWNGFGSRQKMYPSDTSRVVRCCIM